MMFLTASQLLPTSRRNLTRNMEADGNVWWVQTLGASSLIQKGLLSILLWGPSISLSSRLHLLNICEESERRAKGHLSQARPAIAKTVLLVSRDSGYKVEIWKE